MGAPDMAPQTPLTLVTPRRSRGAPRHQLSALDLQGPRGLLGIRALVGLERLAAVGVGRGAVEEPEDLRQVVLVDAHLVQAADVLVAQRLVFGAAEPELAGQGLEVGVPALAQAGVAADVEDHLVEGQGLVAALDVTHAPPPGPPPSG